MHAPGDYCGSTTCIAVSLSGGGRGMHRSTRQRDFNEGAGLLLFSCVDYLWHCGHPHGIKHATWGCQPNCEVPGNGQE